MSDWTIGQRTFICLMVREVDTLCTPLIEEKYNAAVLIDTCSEFLKRLRRRRTIETVIRDCAQQRCAGRHR